MARRLAVAVSQRTAVLDRNPRRDLRAPRPHLLLWRRAELLEAYRHVDERHVASRPLGLAYRRVRLGRRRDARTELEAAHEALGDFIGGGPGEIAGLAGAGRHAQHLGEIDRCDAEEDVRRVLVLVVQLDQ